MSKEGKEEMERILGGSIGHNRIIPGSVPVDGVEHIYFCDDGCSSKRVSPFNAMTRQFRALTRYANPNHAQYGGVNGGACSLTLPDGSLFHAIGYHGDIAGWRQNIEEGAAGLKVALGRVVGDKFVVSDGRVFALSDCIPKFDY
jgi:hypothetical protein